MKQLVFGLGYLHPVYRKNYEELKEMFDIVGENSFTSTQLNGKVSLPSGKVRGLLKRAYEEKTGVLTRSGRSPYDYQFTQFAVEVFGDENDN